MQQHREGEGRGGVLPISQSAPVNVHPTLALERGALERLYNFLKTPTSCGLVMEGIASLVFDDQKALIGLRQDLNLDIGAIHELNEITFKKIIDLEAPTLGVCAVGAPLGFTLMGMQAIRERQKGKKTANVIFLNSRVAGQISSSETKESFFLQANYGVLVDGNGAIHLGHFPRPVRINKFAGVDTDSYLQKLCERIDFPRTMTSKLKETCSDKKSTKIFLQTLGLRTPKSIDISPDLLNSPEELKQTVQQFVNDVPTAGIVVKAARGAGGMQVRMHYDKRETTVLRSVQQLLKTGALVLIEELHKSFPKYDQEGTREDWNLRDLINGQGSIVSLVRSREDGTGPVNKLRGARPEPRHVALEALDISAEQRLALNEELERTETVLASAVGDSLVGSDRIVNENLEVVFLEVNTGRIGGVTTLARLPGTLEARLSSASNLLRALSAGLQGGSLHLGAEAVDVHLNALRDGTAVCEVLQQAAEMTDGRYDCKWVLDAVRAVYHTLDESAFTTKQHEDILLNMMKAYAEVGCLLDSIEIQHSMEPYKESKRAFFTQSMIARDNADCDTEYRELLELFNRDPFNITVLKLLVGTNYPFAEEVAKKFEAALKELAPNEVFPHVLRAYNAHDYKKVVDLSLPILDQVYYNLPHAIILCGAARIQTDQTPLWHTLYLHVSSNGFGKYAHLRFGLDKDSFTLLFALFRTMGPAWQRDQGAFMIQRFKEKNTNVRHITPHENSLMEYIVKSITLAKPTLHHFKLDAHKDKGQSVSSD